MLRTSSPLFPYFIATFEGTKSRHLKRRSGQAILSMATLTLDFVRERVRAHFSHLRRLRKSWGEQAGVGVKVATRVVNTHTKLTFVHSAHWGVLSSIPHLPVLTEGKVDVWLISAAIRFKFID